MKQRWAELLFLHWRVPAASLRALVPAALELDTFEGDAYVGLVPFTMTGVRPVWAPSVPGLSNFHETNVRTYVHYRGEPGVWFFSLDAANSIAVRIARGVWHLPYFRADMTLAQEPSGETHYRTERRWPPPTPAGAEVRYKPVGPVRHATPGTLEHFLAERYILYARKGDALLQGRVHHVPYPLQDVELGPWKENLLAASGIARGEETPSALFAKEVTVDVFALEQVG